MRSEGSAWFVPVYIPVSCRDIWFGELRCFFPLIGSRHKTGSTEHKPRWNSYQALTYGGRAEGALGNIPKIRIQEQ